MKLSLVLRSLLLQAGFSDKSRQALGFAWALDPALRAARRGDPAGLREARLRQLACVNTQPAAAGLVLGVAASLEARAAAGDAAAAPRTGALKGPLCASLAGALDGLFWGALRPLAAAIAVAAAAAAYRLGLPPFETGAAAGLLAFNLPSLAARFRGAEAGLRDGERACAVAAELPVQLWAARARVAAGASVLAAVAAALTLPFQFSRPIAAAGFIAGALLARPAGGALRLTAGAGAAGALAHAAGWSV